MSELHDLFSASVGAAAALIGLLFVAISIAPGNVFGAGADSAKRADAVGAFTALANVFFVSLAGLIPNATGYAVLLTAVISIVRIVQADVAAARRWPGPRPWRERGAISIVLYLLEGAIGLRMVLHATSGETLTYIIFVLYSYALGVAWKLLGAGEQRLAP